MPYSVSILNDFDVAVMVEIRTGNDASDYSNNRLFFGGSLPSGESRNPDNDDPIVCYRRTADPDNSGSGMGAWNTFSPNDINTPVTLKLSEAG